MDVEKINNSLESHRKAVFKYLYSIALLVSCPTCGVQPSYKCIGIRNKRDQVLLTPHKSRVSEGKILKKIKPS